MKKVTIIGGAGTVGDILLKQLHEDYDLLVLDKSIKQNTATHCYVDATDMQSLTEAIPEDTDVLINLLRIETSQAIEPTEVFNQMTDVFFKASYYMMFIADMYKIPKVIFASSNHVTDYYEENGYSKLGREITTQDYPAPKGLYGVLKIASEQAGFIFSLHTDLSILNIRIGSVPNENELVAMKKTDRLSRTLLSKNDLGKLFSAAIESTIKFGTYYGVSNNTDKPWDLSNTIKELGFSPERK
ncbi:NAD-dependent epimerase/dehydratase family protein [Gracilibacillus sp. S3-1-1]|uniref:NAD-dependent epimerase/dehydratase family protein n=1 Tax=Gracilibacillus pellucidus TaxID=3095368 RepID=A0ACC6M2R6_9BACI|nr:NAD-dependent epimerase/dehydratase family protein [Gracilibacillus sp. S3-1-1]MDX8045232.1 NAD-dependent epimerase/dehydratase family protein [Gracilibacillus sp. S3-1-1]